MTAVAKGSSEGMSLSLHSLQCKLVLNSKPQAAVSNVPAIFRYTHTRTQTHTLAHSSCRRVAYLLWNSGGLQIPESMPIALPISIDNGVSTTLTWSTSTRPLRVRAKRHRNRTQFKPFFTANSPNKLGTCEGKQKWN